MSAATDHSGAALLTSWQASSYIPIFFFFFAFFLAIVSPPLSPSLGQR